MNEFVSCSIIVKSSRISITKTCFYVNLPVCLPRLCPTYNHWQCVWNATHGSAQLSSYNSHVQWWTVQLSKGKHFVLASIYVRLCTYICLPEAWKEKWSLVKDLFRKGVYMKFLAKMAAGLCWSVVWLC